MGVVWVGASVIGIAMHVQWTNVTYSVKESLLSKSATLSNEPFFTTPTSLFLE